MLRNKYQTRTQVLLGILYDEAFIDLEESNERIELLKKENDIETLEIEHGMNRGAKDKLIRIGNLIGESKGEYSTSATTVEILISNNKEIYKSIIL